MFQKAYGVFYTPLDLINVISACTAVQTQLVCHFHALKWKIYLTGVYPVLSSQQNLNERKFYPVFKQVKVKLKLPVEIFQTVSVKWLFTSWSKRGLNSQDLDNLTFFYLVFLLTMLLF